MASCCLLLAVSLALMLDGSHSEFVNCQEYRGKLVAMDRATLPCAFTYNGKTDIVVVWQVDGKSPVLRANSTGEVKVWDKFRGRVLLPPGWYLNGTATLRISGLQISDSGNYSCVVRADGPAEFCSEVKLEVKSAGTFQLPQPSSVWIPLLLLSWTGLLL